MSAVRPRPYIVNNYRGLNKKEEEQSSNSSTPAAIEENTQQAPQSNGKKTIQQQLAESQATHQSAVISRDANLKNATINIAQILKDFRSTAKAIGASPELTEEVNEYLGLVEKQVTKETPDVRIIKSNLKNASSLLDNYISETLQRPSKVVENWIDALFLQQINYKFNEKEINPHFLVKFPNSENGEENSRISADNEEDKTPSAKSSRNIDVPQDEKLKSLFLSAKKYTYANDSQKAMEFFKQALERAVEVQDKETESKVLFEIGKIYDKNDYLVQALASYNRSIQKTSDTNVKTKAHYSMAQIYDDVAQFEPAINHYMTSISFAGQAENLAAQSTSLTRIGNIYSDEYKKEAFEFLHEADLLSKQTDNHKVKGFVSSNIANAYDKFNEPQNALKYYSNAVKEYQETDAVVKVAENYKRAAEVMKDFNNPIKAKTLFQKALAKARLTENVQLMKEISEAMSAI